VQQLSYRRSQRWQSVRSPKNINTIRYNFTPIEAQSRTFDFGLQCMPFSGNWSLATTNSMLFPGISISSAPLDKTTSTLGHSKRS
jgi:hypothetical protein